MLTLKDRVSFLVAIASGTLFGYVTILAGFGAVLVGGVYAGPIVPLIIFRIADQRKFLVWQFCIIPFALVAAVMSSRGAPLGWQES
jgi:hypothetical protein